MLFNSYEFIFLFLPVTLAVFYFLSSARLFKPAIAWLLIASLFFYGWWSPKYLILILLSMFFNYTIGYWLGICRESRRKKVILYFGVLLNLAFLGYYKYTNFFIDNLNTVFNTSFSNYAIILPLGISFFTFQQIAYLVDAHQGQTREYNFINYGLFVTFFPQLIAGPIVHHKEMLPQFKDCRYLFSARNFSVGITFFAIGLFKKVMLADNLSHYASPVFNAVKAGDNVSCAAAWIGVLCYTFQIYFDFSGYSDMAIGLGRIFGIRLPLNFNSPYKSTGIIEFWRRWHMTLSRFLRDYLYIPLGGNKKGKFFRYLNLMIVMVFGGLWHGANWTFVLWGAFHGFGLVLNHGWRNLIEKKKVYWTDAAVFRILSVVLTFISVAFAWVLFRAESVGAALKMYFGLFGLSGREVASLPVDIDRIMSIVVSLLIVWLLPNTQEFMKRYRPAVDFKIKQCGLLIKWLRWIVWQPKIIWSFFISAVFLISIFNMLNVSEFLYFQF